MDEETKKDLLAVIDSGWWGNGSKVLEFEKAFAEKVGAKYAVATNSCTSSLDLCLKVYDIKGGELITTPMTFVSDAIVGEFNGMDVTFADIDPKTLCIDPGKILIKSKTKAIIAVDSHGRLADIKTIQFLAHAFKKENEQKILVVEDAAHACYTPGAGQYADITVWSFQAVKSLPIFDGGMITTNDEEIAKKLKTLTWLGVEKSTFDRVSSKGYSWEYDIKQADGIKGYMTDIQAVIGLGQLRRLDSMLEKRRDIQSKYNNAFAQALSWFNPPVHSHTVQYYTAEWLDRDKLCEYLAEQGISTSVHFMPLSETTYWKKAKKHPIPVTDKVWKNLLSLPVFYTMTDQEVDHVIKSVIKFYEGK